MSKPFDRDRSVERLLGAARQPAAGRGSERTAACPDGDVIAAWVDGSLGENEARSVETHLATCPYCQAVLAAVGQMTPAAASPPPWWRRWFVLVPIAATAAATLLIVLNEPSMAPKPVAVPLPPPAVARNVAPPQLQAEAPPVTEQKAQSAAPTSRPAPAPQPVLPAPPPPAPPPIPAVPVAAPSNAVVSELSLGETVLADFTSSEASSSTAADATAPTRGAGGGGGGRGGGRVAGGAGGAGFALRSSTIVQPPVRWQVMTTGVVRRSLDSGATWQRVTIETDVTMTTGAAPSRLICWLAGRRGALLLSIDGQTFARVDLPESVDIASIRAQSALVATVITVAGREFSTADGGHTWR